MWQQWGHRTRTQQQGHAKTMRQWGHDKNDAMNDDEDTVPHKLQWGPAQLPPPPSIPTTLSCLHHSPLVPPLHQFSLLPPPSPPPCSPPPLPPLYPSFPLNVSLPITLFPHPLSFPPPCLPITPSPLHHSLPFPYFLPLYLSFLWITPPPSISTHTLLHHSPPLSPLSLSITPPFLEHSM